MPTVTGRATDFITFSRTSNATVTGADGRIRWAGHNLLTNSESFDASAWSKTHTASAAPVVTANAGVAPNGTTTADRADMGAIDASGDYSQLAQSATTAAGTYTGAVWVKAFAAGDVGKKIWLYLYDTTERGIVSATLTDSWQLITTSFALSGAASFAMAIATLGSAFSGGANQGAVSVLLWGAHLYRSDLGGMQLNPAMPAGMQTYYPTTPRNLLGFTEDFSAASWNAVTNATVVSNIANGPNGLPTADLIYPSSSGSNRQRYQTVAGQVSGTRYTVSVYLKAASMQWIAMLSPNGANYGAYFDLVNGVKGTEASGVTATITSVGDGWYRCSVSQVSSGTTIYCGFSFADANGGTTVTASGTSGVYAWGAQLSDSASLDAYSPVYGAAVTSAAYYAPRLDYDANGSALGLLVEEQRTNLTQQSQNFGTTWTLPSSAGTLTQNAVAPDGTTTAWTLAETASVQASIVRQTYSALSANAHTFSVHVKLPASNAATWIMLQTRGNAATVYRAWFNISTGVKGTSSGSPTDYTISPLGSGWYRVSVVFPGGSGSDTPLTDISPVSGDGAATPTASTDKAILIWGAQLEIGASGAAAPFMTSYIPTGAATATRTADVASVSTQAFPYSASAGSWVAAFSQKAAIVNGRVIGNTNTAASPTPLAVNNSTSVLTWNGANVLASSSGPNVTGAVKAGMAYDATGRILVYAGTTATSDAFLVPSDTAFNLGAGQGGGNYLNGWIRQITYIPRRLSSSELQARTV